MNPEKLLFNLESKNLLWALRVVFGEEQVPEEYEYWQNAIETIYLHALSEEERIELQTMDYQDFWKHGTGRQLGAR